MNPYLEPPGFLGTGASLLADITLVAYLLLIIPLMLIGLVFARRKLHRPHHKWAMTLVTLINWVLIVFLMFAAYRFDVAPNFPQQPDNTRYLLPVVHGFLGIPAQLLATFIVLRMFLEDRNVARAKARGEKDTSRYWFRSAKPVMRLTLILWLATATLGVLSYLTRYEVIPTYILSVQEAGVGAAPEGTPDVQAPEATAELVATSEVPVATPEVTPELTLENPAATPEVTIEAPVETPEATAELNALLEMVDVPVQTPEVTPMPPAETPEVAEPVETPEIEAPVATPEVSTPVETPEVEAEDEDFRVEGRLEAVGSAAVIVDGQRYDISNARVDDPLRVGLYVRMEVRRVNGQLIVDRIRAEDDD